MMWRGVFTHELKWHLQRPITWVYLVVLLGLSAVILAGFYDDARRDGFHGNSSLTISGVTVIISLLSLLVTADVAGNAATRDVHTRMEPLVYTTPLRKRNYIAGRFLAAFAVCALLMLAVPMGILLTLQLRGPEPELLGPFRLNAYLSAYLLFALPTVFATTAIQFSFASLNRHVLGSYGISAVLFLVIIFTKEYLAVILGKWALAKQLDLTGFTIVSEAWRSWTAAQKNALLLGPDSALISNRLLWLALALGALALAYFRLWMAHHVPASPLRHRWQQLKAFWTEPAFTYGPEPEPDVAANPAGLEQVIVPPVAKRFDLQIRLQQLLCIAWRSFLLIIRSRISVVLPALVVVLLHTGTEMLEGELGTPSLPATGLIVGLYNHFALRFIIVTLISLYAGKLLWTEREARLNDIADAAPVPDAVLFLGRLLGLCLMLVMVQLVFLCGGVFMQAVQGYYHFEPVLYLQVLFGLQLTDYVLFAVVALLVHVLVNQPQTGHLVLLLTFLFTVFSGHLGIRHHLLVFGTGPAWTYSDISGFGLSILPWLWFKFYWAGWALLLAVLTNLLWVRGREQDLKCRFRQALLRFKGRALPFTGAAAALVLLPGGFLFYNTNLLNEYTTPADTEQQRARYEQLYGRYRYVPQPVLAGTSLQVDIYPKKAEAKVRGSYVLINKTAAAIDTLHLLTYPKVSTSVQLVPQAREVLTDRELGHRMYRLSQPLQPGDTVHLQFEVQFRPNGIPHDGLAATVAPNGTHIDHMPYLSHNEKRWLPLPGYQPNLELDNAKARQKYGLSPRPAMASYLDERVRQDLAGREPIAFEAVVSTDADQMAVASGTMRKTWTRNGRRHFHYRADAPIRNGYAFFSAAYQVREARWQNVQILIYHHHGHTTNLDRMIRSTQAALAYYTRHFGPYPHRQIRFVEAPSPASRMLLHSDPTTISYSEGFALLNPDEDYRHLDLPFAVVAHEVAHQWWGNQLIPASAEGSSLLTESLAWYSGMMVVEHTLGKEHLERLLRMMRREFISPRPEADVPLLRASDHFHVYRKGPFAMYALREYLGEQRVNTALRQFFRKHSSGQPPLPVSVDLYQELQAVTPDSLQYLLADLLAHNTFWDLKTERVQATQISDGWWQVTLEVRARKIAVDTAGIETKRLVNDFVEVGVYAAETDNKPGKQLYLRMHRLREGRQIITVTVPEKPAAAGIDPRLLLIDPDMDDNVQEVAARSGSGESSR